MQTLDTLTMDTAFADAIMAITPSFEPFRGLPWHRVGSVRFRRLGGQAELPSVGTRHFDLLFTVAGPTYQWHGGTGTAYRLRLAVATSYAGIEPVSFLSHMLIADAVDLRRALNRLVDPTLPGLVHVEPAGIANEKVDEQGDLYVEHTFLVDYHQATVAA